jgi:replicative DNA helicase
MMTFPSDRNLAAEKVVLGAIVEDDGLLGDVLATGLTEEDFSLSDHQRIFRAIEILREKNSPIDYVTLTEQLGNKDEDCVAVANLVQGVVVHYPHVIHHAQIVRKKARLRSLIKLAEWISEVVKTNAEPDEVVEQVSGRLDKCCMI